jgi:RNA polymerase sigma-B factor
MVLSSAGWFGRACHGLHDELTQQLGRSPTIADLAAHVDVAEEQIIEMIGNLSQSQIAEQVGLSQMHVSRLLRHSLEFLRRRMTE